MPSESMTETDDYFNRISESRLQAVKSESFPTNRHASRFTLEGLCTRIIDQSFRRKATWPKVAYRTTQANHLETGGK